MTRCHTIVVAEPTQISQLLKGLHRDAAWEDGQGARQHAEAIARLGGDAAVDALIGVLVKMAAVDLSEDGGDVSDECWRASTAAVHGLTLLGQIAVPRLRAIVDGAESRAQDYAITALSIIEPSSS